jgi:hypothetical protein
MEMFIDPFIIIIVLVTVLVLCFCFYMLYLNKKVYELRIKIIDLCGDYDKRHILEFRHPNESALYWLYNELPTYGEMMYSFKPIRLQTFITEEQYQKLIN